MRFVVVGVAFTIMVCALPARDAKPGAGETAARASALSSRSWLRRDSAGSPGIFEEPAARLAAVSAVGRTTRKAGNGGGFHPATAPISYWVAEFRRRWREERADGKARARTIRRLRRTLMVRASKVPAIEGVWMALASCESGRRWSYNGPSGFDGGLQFHPGTWRAYRRPWEPAYAYEAPPDVQVAVARRVLAVEGWGAWPVCSYRIGAR